MGGGIETVPGILLAKRQNLHVVVSDWNSDAPGMRLADDTLLASTYDVEQTVEAAKQYHQSVRAIDGVLCLATDVPLTVASVAAELGLAGASVQTACIVSDKVLMKDVLRQAGVQVPWYQEICDIAGLKESIAKLHYPVVVKPVDSRGARGVLRITSEIDLAWAFQYAKSYSPSGRVMVEKFLDGPQVSTEALVIKGKAYTIGFSDRNYEFMDVYAPHIIENGGELPSFFAEDIQDAIAAVMQRAAESIGLENGVLKGDIVVHQNEVYIIEVAARLSGGYFCTHEIPLNTGIDFVGNAIKIALGEAVDTSTLRATWRQAVVQRYLFPKQGRVMKISGVEEASALPGIELCEIRVTEGDLIGPIDNHPARAGVIIAVGSSRAEALQRVKRALDTIVIEIDG